MTEAYPFPKVSWRVAPSGKRTVLQSSPIYEHETEEALTRWLIATFSIEAIIKDNIKKTARSLSSRRLPEESAKRIELRNISPDLFTQTTGVPVADNQELWAAYIAQQHL